MEKSLKQQATFLPLALLLASMGIFPMGCTPSSTPPESRSWPVMGTFASVSVPATESDRVQGAVEVSQQLFEDVNDEVTVWHDRSEIAALNRQAGGAFKPLSRDAYRLLELSVEFADVSGGAFDPTISPLIHAWGFSGGTAPVAPLSEDDIRKALQQTGFRHIQLTNQSARLALPGMSVDLGGIAKGYAVDRAFEALQAKGYENLMINLGGNMRCGGHGRGRNPWTIGVRDPFHNDEILGTVQLTDGWALATSGNYERFVTIQGKRYAHIIDPRDGKPVSGMAGVTVLCKTAVDADALSTAFFVLGREATREQLKQIPDCHVLMVEDHDPLTILVSPGFKMRFKPLPQVAERIRPL